MSFTPIYVQASNIVYHPEEVYQKHWQTIKYPAFWVLQLEDPLAEAEAFATGRVFDFQDFIPASFLANWPSDAPHLHTLYTTPVSVQEYEQYPVFADLAQAVEPHLNAIFKAIPSSVLPAAERFWAFQRLKVQRAWRPKIRDWVQGKAKREEEPHILAQLQSQTWARRYAESLRLNLQKPKI